ncbi:MAG: IPT/TIG domain-containing protein [Acidobacteria bacterium]|nr:IPT/TIG domain-containing protein [Acidobacteriota bacterium]
MGERMLGETTMKTMKTRTVATIATVLLLALFGCQSESPTEPSTGGGGGTTPPTSDITITLTASNVNPPVGSSAVITARATSAGANVVNGTAIEFATTFGSFVETAGTFALRTTSGGAANVTLTSAEVGSAVVTARLGNVSKSITINFEVDGGSGDGPQISSVTPSSGPPSGNQVVTIVGSNFRTPVRVFFGSKEATVVSVTDTQIKAVTPATNLAASEQFREVDVRVIAEAGTANEAAATLTNGYRYELEILTPSIEHVSPASGPNEGNTRITIFGSGFQSPAKVFFGAGATQVELDVTSVTFSQIQATTPAASGLGSSFLNSSVSVRVLNLASGTQATLANAFRYGPEIEITGVSPSVGTHLGGDRVTVFGFGFDDPVQVSIAGIPAQVVRVSGTEVVVLTGAIQCDGGGGGAGGGSVVVTNLEQPAGTGTATLDNGFTYRVTTKILSVSPLPLVEGAGGSIVVDDPGFGNVKLSIGGKTVFPAPAAASDAFAATTFTFVVPAGLEFETDDCITGGGVTGTIDVVTDFEIEFENILNGCGATISVPIAPAAPTCVTEPAITVSPAGSFGVVAEGATADILFTVTNIGGVPVSGLNVSGVVAPFSVLVPLNTTSLAPAGSAQFTLRFSPPVTGTDADYSAPAAVDFSGGTFALPLSGSGNAP